VAEGDILIKVNAKQLKKLANTTNQVNKAFKRTTGSAKQLSNVAGNLGSRLGFVAFQFTFMAGVAGRALQDITRRLQEFTQEGAKDLSSIGRAISRSGFDITAAFGDDKVAIDLLNDAIRTFGSGTTVFNVGEVAEAFNAVGRAITFTGTTLERAQQQIIITKNVLNLMTIEEQGAETAAINLIKTMKQFGLTVQDAAHAADVLVAVNNQSSITLDGLVRSLGFAGQQARQFGITFEDTAVILGVIQDRLGVLNGGPGRNFSILLESLSDTTTSLNSTLAGFGIRIRDAEGRLLPFNQILKQTKDALERTGGAGTLANEIILEQISTTSRGARALLALIQGYDELQISFDNLSESEGIAADLAKRFGELPEERIKRLKNAVAQLRVEFVGGLAPALGQMVDAMRSVVVDSNIQQFMISLGNVIGQNILPFVKTLTTQFKFFAAVLGKNKILLKVVTGLFIGLLGVLGTLFIVGTLGALISVLGSTIARLAASTAFLTLVNSVWFASMLKIFAIAAGVFIVLKAVDNILGIFKEGLEASELPALALNAALVLIGVTLGGLGLGIITLGSLKAAITGISFASLGGAFSTTGFMSAIKAMKVALFGLSAGTTAQRVTAGMQGLGGASGTGFGKGLLPILRGLSKGPIIIAAVAAAAAIAIAFTAKMLQEAEDSPIFKNGLVKKWDLVGIKMQFATAKFVKGIGDWFVGIGAFIAEVLKKIGEDWATLVESLGTFDPAKIRAALDQFLDNFDLQDALRKQFDLDFALKEAIKKISITAKGEGLTVDSSELREAIDELIKDAEISTVTKADIDEILKGIFGRTPALESLPERIGIAQGDKDILGPLISQRDVLADQMAEIAKEITAAGGNDFLVSGLIDEKQKLQEEFNALGNRMSQLFPGEFLTPDEIIKLIGLPSISAGDVASITDTAEVILIPAIEEAAEAFQTIPDVLEITKEAMLEEVAVIQVETEQRILLTEQQLAEVEQLLKLQEAELAAIQGMERRGTETEEIIEREIELKASISKLKDEITNGVLVETDQNKQLVETTKTLKELETIEIEKIDTETIQNNLLLFMNDLYKSSFIPILFQQMQAYLRVESTLNELDEDLDNLRQAIIDLTNRIAGTKVKFEKNEEGEVTGFKLVGGVSKSEANSGFGFLASGGIVNGPTRAIVGEKGPEAVIPLNKLEGLGGTTIGDINITVEGSASEETAEEIANMVAEVINNNIKNKPLLT